MLLFCPACQSAFTGVSRCPRCGGLLLMPEEAPPPPDEPGAAPPVPLHPTPAGRVTVGTVAALGLYLGLRKVMAGWVYATEADPDAWWRTADGLAVVFGLQAAAAVFGAVLASAGRGRGFALGALVGGLCGGLFLAAEVAGGAPGGQVVLLVQPLVLGLVGALAGAVGTWVWAAAPEFDMPLPALKALSSVRLLGGDRPSGARRPTAWLRVLLGAAVMVAGVGLVEQARGRAEKATGGFLRAETRGQAKFLSWQMAALAVLAGGAVAGANTGAGLRHGILAGVLGGAGVAGLSAAQGVFSAPAEYLLDRLHLTGAAVTDPGALATVAGGVLLAGLVGGWLGGQLFLPLAPAHMRPRSLTVAGD